MFRKLLFFVAAPAFLSLLTAGALQARPLAIHPMAPAGLQELWHWVTSGGPGNLEKEGPGMDPNGNSIKLHGPNPGCSPHGTVTRPNRGAAKGR